MSEDQLQTDERFMRHALDLARATVALASPNPQVGCVLVGNGEIVGEGAHLYDQRDHAEIVALKLAGERARGATAYVTLEPCSHQGRTGPCADALIAAGVSRVVAATVDPNPQVSGRGIERMRAAEIEVAVGVLQTEARAINEAFAHSIRTGRPLVTLKAALSADGMLAPPPATRTTHQPFWLTGPESRAEVQRMRHAADAVLTGIGTVLADDPLLTDRSGLARRRPLLRVVLDSRLRTPLDSQLVRSAQSDLLLIWGSGKGETAAQESDATTERIAAFEAEGVEVVRVAESNGKLDLSAVLDVLAQRQILSLLLECGSRLNGAFLAQDLVDRVALFHAPTNLGEDAVPFAAGYVSPEQLEQSLVSPQRTTFGADNCVSALLHDPWF